MLNKSKVKYIQSLSYKKQRDHDSVFVAEGPKIIKELLAEKNIQLKELFATEEWLAAHRHLLPDGVSQIHAIKSFELDKISFLSTPNEVLGVFEKPSFAATTQLSGITLVLDTIQDPGNMGTIIRCADWFGVKRIICSPNCADAYNPKVVQSAMGSVGRIAIETLPLLNFLQNITEIPIFAATLKGASIHKIPPQDTAVLIIGNESKGIDEILLKYVTHEITIPGSGNAESLNAAVATGILLSRLVG